MLYYKVLLIVFLYQECSGNRIYRRDVDKELTKDGLEVPAIEVTPGFVEDAATDINPVTEAGEDKLIEQSTQIGEGKITDVNPVTKPGKDEKREDVDCPPDKSLNSRKDVGVFIDYVFKNLELNDTLMEKLVPKATFVNNKHMKEFEKFDKWFMNQPENLLNVLQGLSTLRKQRVEPEAQKISVILQEYPQLKEQIHEKQNKREKFVKRITKYENLCKYACDDPEPVMRRMFKRSIPDDYICSSIEDLNNNITSKLTENFDVFLKEKLDFINDTDNLFTEEINRIKKELKSAALSEYGRTMYDVLSLEDEFNNFVKEINSTKAKDFIYQIKDVGVQIDTKLLELQRLIEDYGKHCRNCNSGPLRRVVRQTNIHDAEESKNGSISILDELIQEKYNKVNITINEELDEIFKNLTNLINDPEIKEKYLVQVKLMQKNIVDAWNVEKDALKNLKSIASQDSLEQLPGLLAVSIKLQKNIDDDIKHVQELLDKK